MNTVGTWGIIVSLAGLLFSFWKAHRDNMDKIKANERELGEMKAKLDIVYDWVMDKKK